MKIGSNLCWSLCKIEARFEKRGARNIMARFWKSWHSFRLGLVLYYAQSFKSWHDPSKLGRISAQSDFYIRLHSSIFWEGFKRENLGKPNEITLGLRVFGERFFGLESISQTPWIVRFHWRKDKRTFFFFFYCFLFGFIVDLSDLKNGSKLVVLCEFVS